MFGWGKRKEIELTCIIYDEDSLIIDNSEEENFDFAVYSRGNCQGSVRLDLESAIKIRDFLIERTK